MLDIGFRPDIEKILGRCPKKRQTLLLSATVPPPVERLAHRYMHDPLVLNFSPQMPAADTIDQYYFTVDQEKKFPLLVRLLEREKPEQAIVFCRTKRETDRVFHRLRKKINDVDCIHGDMPQPGRDRVMRRFRDRQVRILVATDVVGRGIDVTSISHIINFDIPQSSDDYVHRVGRTGRMGREGVAYTFVTTEEGPELTRIEMLINRLLKREELTDFEAFERPTEEPDDQAASPAQPPKETPPGQRPRRRYRRAL
jgi:ATP-dependent RNA helicase DeaD